MRAPPPNSIYCLKLRPRKQTGFPLVVSGRLTRYRLPKQDISAWAREICCVIAEDPQGFRKTGNQSLLTSSPTVLKEPQQTGSRCCFGGGSAALDKLLDCFSYGQDRPRPSSSSSSSIQSFIPRTRDEDE